MWIERVRVSGWGAFPEGGAIIFDRRATVVLGDNESGKTSLAAAVRAVLFGEPPETWTGQGSGASWGEVRLHAGKRRIDLTRDFRSGEVTIEEGGRRLYRGSEEAEVRSRLGELLGPAVGSPRSRCGIVLQGDLGAGIEESLREWLVEGASGRDEVALARLTDSHRRLAGGEGTPGALEEVRQELAVRRSELDAWEENAARMRGLLSDLDDCREKLALAESSAKEREEILDNLLRFQELTRERTRLEEALVSLRQERDRIRQQVESVERVEADLEREFPDFLNAPTDLEDIIHSWMESTTRLRHLRSDQDRITQGLSGMPRVRTRRNGLLAGAALAFLGWLACLGAGAGALGLLFVPLFAAAGYGAVWYLDLNADRMRSEREEELKRLTEEKEEMERRERDARNRLGMLGRFSNPLILRKEFRRFLEARGELEHARGARDSQRALSEVVDHYERALHELQVIDTETRDLVVRARYLGEFDGSPQAMGEEMERARKRREETAAEVEAIHGRIGELTGEISRLEAETQEPARLAEDIQELEERERRLRAEAAAMEEAIVTLRRAISAFQAGHLSRIAEDTARFFRAFSQGRFTEVRITPEFALEGSDGMQWVSRERMSRGTRDQLLLALRLAVNASLGEGFPVVLDEVFPLWDDARLAEAREVLAGHADGGRQVIVLSRDARLAGWGGKTVRLPKPEANGLKAA